MAIEERCVPSQASLIESEIIDVAARVAKNIVVAQLPVFSHSARSLKDESLIGAIQPLWVFIDQHISARVEVVKKRDVLSGSRHDAIHGNKLSVAADRLDKIGVPAVDDRAAENNVGWKLLIETEDVLI